MRQVYYGLSCENVCKCCWTEQHEITHFYTEMLSFSHGKNELGMHCSISSPCIARNCCKDILHVFAGGRPGSVELRKSAYWGRVGTGPCPEVRTHCSYVHVESCMSEEAHTGVSASRWMTSTHFLIVLYTRFAELAWMSFSCFLFLS